MEKDTGMTNCPFCFKNGKITLLRYDDSVTPKREYICEVHGDLIWDCKKKQFNLSDE